MAGSLTTRQRIDWVNRNINTVALAVFLCAHGFFAIFFGILGAASMCLLNIIGAAFYLSLLYYLKDTSPKRIVQSYFFAIAFSCAATIIGGQGTGFCLCALSAIAVMFCLAEEKGRKRYLFEAIGGIAVIASYAIAGMLPGFSADEAVIQPYTALIFLLNFIIAGSTMVLMLFTYGQKLNREHRALAYHATHDDLTGLLNRSHLLKRLERSKPGTFALCILDIDDFRSINTSFGQEGGDLILCSIAQILRSSLPSGFAACRWGGEQFLVLMPDTDEDGAFTTMDRLREEIKMMPVRNAAGETMRCTVSGGISFAAAQEEPADVIRRADANLIAGKSVGKNVIVND